ncbi:SH3 domain-containing protein [Pseudooctadecabacter jejudonensis]|uniref:Bacterial SH3 domain protein n=1 Tax=Pseudooctadecabacter jejudonensis TaxID=1391910 RepID=A0A1Y5SYA9_9RHOB|nr:SH3 domain-containing protein [Pseudooctadecabacter jejudonensis]SLN51788.1 Bacterial SH3 domain protein [Pseudooctadecabacter jejudonensis]
MMTGRVASFLLALVLASGAVAQETTETAVVTPITAVQGDRGPVTNLPMPRYVSLKANEANVRRGPSLSHRIDWVFQRRDMPLRVVGEYGHWRRVVDREGMGGWVHYSLLSGNRTVIIDHDMLTIRQRPDDTAMEVAHLELGVIADLGECDVDWCRLRAGGYRGWAEKTALFGVAPGELRD